MDICKRLFRRPFSTALWGVLVSAMSLLLCAGGALWYSSENMVTTLDGMYTAAAFRTNKAVVQEGTTIHVGVKHLLQEDLDFLEELESVEAVYFHTLTGAYSPAFTPVLNPNHGSDPGTGFNQGYDDVVLIGKVVWTGPSQELANHPYDMTSLGMTDQENLWSWEGTIQVEQVVRKHTGYQIAENAQLRVHVSTHGTNPADFFELNGRYLVCADVVYGTDLFCTQMIPKDGILLNTRFVYSSRINEDGKEHVNIKHLQTWPGAAAIGDSLEDFLADPDNHAWNDYLEVWDKAHHSVPVLGTDNLESMYGFLCGDVSVVKGRSFTPEEYETGAKVCVISESMALESGLKLGDTISLSQFHITEIWNKSLDGAAAGGNVDGLENNPTIGEFETDTEFVTENEVFTVIGIYRKPNTWDEGPWAFTVNTVFMPKAAQIPGGYGTVSTVEKVAMEDKFPGAGVTGFMNEYIDRGNYGIYLSVLLKKGHMEEFCAALENTKLYGEFFTNDQGYEAMIGSVRDVGAASRKLLLITAAGWALLLALYVLLYQGGQRKNLGIMRSLGAGPGQVRRYLFSSGLLLAAVSIALGTLISKVVIRRVNDALLTQMLEITENSQFSSGQGLNMQDIAGIISGSQLPDWGMAILLLVQLFAFIVVLWIQASNLSGKKPRRLLGV